jgi:hypothetical protein
MGIDGNGLWPVFSLQRILDLFELFSEQAWCASYFLGVLIISFDTVMTRTFAAVIAYVKCGLGI